MHIISRKALIHFWKKYPESGTPLTRWYKIVDKTDFRSFAELRKAFPSVDRMKDLFIFNTAGNNFRLITSIHFNRGKVFVRHVLTHKEYDTGEWKK